MSGERTNNRTVVRTPAQKTQLAQYLRTLPAESSSFRPMYSEIYLVAVVGSPKLTKYPAMVRIQKAKLYAPSFSGPKSLAMTIEVMNPKKSPVPLKRKL